MTAPLLSICIPTYQRRERIVTLVRELLNADSCVQICVHVDGSTDGSWESLASLDDPRLRISQAVNQGRAGALLAACRLAEGRFTMIFDDDDTLYPEGLAQVIEDCRGEVPPDVTGFIYHLEDQNGERIGDAFPCERSNFLALRADQKVRRDKKEVVRTDHLLACAHDPRGRARRVPTSLLWSRLALRYDVICRNYVIGRKVYLDEGMTANIRQLKRRNARPMLLLHLARMQGFIFGRYRRLRYFVESALGVLGYSVVFLRAAAIKEGRD